MTQVLKAVPASAPKNGAAAQKSQASNEKPPVPAATSKETKTNPSVDFEETSHRLNQLWELQSKFNRLQASKQKLQEFKFQNTDQDDITLTIGTGNYREDFSTKNGEIVKELVSYLTTLIDKKANELKEQIRW